MDRWREKQEGEDVGEKDGPGRRRGGRCFRGVVAYDGTGFGGFQLQGPEARKRTVQGELECALLKVAKGADRRQLSLCASSRTDAGVHAISQIVKFNLPDNTKTSTSCSPEELMRTLNCLLSADVRVLAMTFCPIDFRPSATLSKTYHYMVHVGSCVPPYIRHFRLHLTPPRREDGGTEQEPEAGGDAVLRRSLPFFDEMVLAAGCFEGTHDFTSFTNKADEQIREGRSMVRTVTRCEVVLTSYGFRVEIEGRGFLYKMCRNIVGTLLHVGIGKLPGDAVTTIRELMASRDRSLAPPASAPHGLHLVNVSYAGRDFAAEIEASIRECDSALPG